MVQATDQHVSAGGIKVNYRWREPIAILEHVRFEVEPGRFIVGGGNALLSLQASVDSQSLAAAALALAQAEAARKRVIDHNNEFLMAA